VVQSDQGDEHPAGLKKIEKFTAKGAKDAKERRTIFHRGKFGYFLAYQSRVRSVVVFDRSGFSFASFASSAVNIF
jgi:hypothetical protein